MSKIKNGGLDQYGTEPFEQQQFESSGVEGLNTMCRVFWVCGRLLCSVIWPTLLAVCGGMANIRCSSKPFALLIQMTSQSIPLQVCRRWCVEQ